MDERGAMHPNQVHGIYMDHVNRGAYYVGGFLGKGPMTLSDYCADLIDRWNAENGDDCPRDFCTNRDGAMAWLNERLAAPSPLRRDE